MADEKYIETKLIESQTDESVMAEVKLIKKPEDVEYDKAVLLIDNQPRGAFGTDDKLVFTTNEFGNVSCVLSFYKDEVIIKEIIDTLEMNISSWFVGAHPDLGHPLQKIENGKSIELFSRDRARGNNDICFRMVIRVPEGESLSVMSVIAGQVDKRPKYNQVLKVHCRGVDYKYRNDLYTPPDEAMFHIDKELEKWIMDGLTLEHGIHILYVAPSCEHDLSYLVVTGNNAKKESAFEFSISGFFKTILEDENI